MFASLLKIWFDMPLVKIFYLQGFTMVYHVTHVHIIVFCVMVMGGGERKEKREREREREREGGGGGEDGRRKEREE